MNLSAPQNVELAPCPVTSINSSRVSFLDRLSVGIGPALGLLLVRLWLGARSLASGIEKFAGSETAETLVTVDGQANAWGLTDMATRKVYALSNYQGVPESMLPLFDAQPLLPGFAVTAFNWVLGPALLLFGATVLLGILPRISLFLMGMVYLSLTLGLVLIGQDGGVAWLAAHMILIVIGLLYADRDRFVILGKKW